MADFKLRPNENDLAILNQYVDKLKEVNNLQDELINKLKIQDYLLNKHHVSIEADK